MVETMVAWGVTHVFGMVGHSNLGFADAMRAPGGARATLTFIGIRHEGAAAFAASAYGKLTGRPAACFAIAGPGLDQPAHRPVRRQGRPRAGARALRPGAVEGARPRRVPGRRPRRRVRRRRRLDSQTVLPDSDHAELMSARVQARARRARRRAPRLPRRGADAAGRRRRGRRRAERPRRPTPRSRRREAPSSDARRAASRGAQRPVIIVGHGARFEHGRRHRARRALGAPVAHDVQGQGQIADDHPLACGVLGRSGTPVASWLMNESDLLVVFGASFSNHTGIAPYKPIVQVDFDPMRSAASTRSTVPVLGDVGVDRARCSRELARADACSASTSAPTSPRAGRSGGPRRRAALADDRGHGVASAAVFARSTRHVPDDAVIAVDVGNNAYSFGRYFECNAARRC